MGARVLYRIWQARYLSNIDVDQSILLHYNPFRQLCLMSELFVMPYDHHIVSYVCIPLTWVVKWSNRLIKAPSWRRLPTSQLHYPLNQLEQRHFSQESLLWHFQLQTAQTVSCAWVSLMSSWWLHLFVAPFLLLNRCWILNPHQEAKLENLAEVDPYHLSSSDDQGNRIQRKASYHVVGELDGWHFWRWEL